MPPIVWYFFEAAPAVVVAPNPEATKALMREAVDKNMQRLAAYIPLFWFAYLLFYIFVTCLRVALISYSDKALKGYDATVPIPGVE